MSADAAFTPCHRGGRGSPLVLVHGFTDTWRTWELVLPTLERRHDVLAVTLAGHAGGPPLEAPTDEALLGSLEQAMDDAGFALANVAGNSLGGYLALRLAERGRALSVVALAPAGGWLPGARLAGANDGYFLRLLAQVKQVAPYADALVASPEARRAATQYTTVNFEHIPPALIAHQIRGVAACTGGEALVHNGLRANWTLDAERVTCPVRIVWGTEDRLLPWPDAARRYRDEWLPQADWVVLDGVGHCPQLDVPLETAELILRFATSR